MKAPLTSHSSNSVFHEGEAFAQDLSNADTPSFSKTLAERYKGFIRPFMPSQHRAFFESGPLMMLGLLDQLGHPVAVPIWGDEGYIQSPSDTRLQMELSSNAHALINTHLNLSIQRSSKVGILGLELATRRRNRLNGIIAHVKGPNIHIAVEQSFGNCPQYIHTRDVEILPNTYKAHGKTVHIKDGLSHDVSRVVSSADTFFIASRHASLGDKANEGVDVSHRGGKPGFVKVDNNTLTIPDFSGNNFFNTIGNILTDERVGLCFIENETGTLHFLEGNASVIWDEHLLPKFEGAERFIKVSITKSITAQHFYPFKHKLHQQSPYVASTGNW
jgi:predicted pyridoxine 5'-phosphate oxidase superfamily flavin-nucleotide-binding protein